MILDIVCSICSFLDDYDKIQFLSTNTEIYFLRPDIFFTDPILLDLISDLWYYNSFINIITTTLQVFPTHTKYLTFETEFTEYIENYIPSSVTHLTFNCYFIQDKDNCIPFGVTHLTFKYGFVYQNNYGTVYRFNPNINLCIPSSVINLTFGSVFNMDIAKCIPPNVTHLTLWYTFNEDITGCIPDSVTHLTLGDHYKHDIRNRIPDTVKYLTLSKNYNMNWCKDLKCIININ